MSALLKTAARDASCRKPDDFAFGGFGPDADEAVAGGQLGGAALTMLLVLYPAVASVAVVLAAFMLSGSGIAA
ncbi:hypothetical protein [Kumtagia ephedrae]|jgi:hypothetical protein|uniref:Uncharacterized protein n=1 Tax=Kumtagia ephedrae TaxID=2116701 RepID=A0A2P7S4Y4_9HYPH|nr:hypothetical protein [Mesorhizobium ephedrae]PSJ57501.1 hypothetical protein C7I84_17810 [Mesorhizobium ephedrae]